MRLIWRSPAPLVIAMLGLAMLAPGAVARNVYVANGNGNSVSVFNGRTGKVVGGPIPVGVAPLSIAITADGRTAYVADEGSRSVSAIDLQTHRVVATLEAGSSPEFLKLSPDGRTLWVLSGFGGTVTAIDTATGKISGPPLTLAGHPAELVFAPDGETAYVTLFDADQVAVLNAQSREVTATIPAGDGASAIAITPDGSTLLVGDFLGQTVTAIDTATKLPLGTPIPLVASNPNSISITPDGATAYVTHLEEQGISVIDVASRVKRSTVMRDADLFATAAALSPDGRTLYVANGQANSVSALDTQSGRFPGPPVGVGAFPDAVAVAPRDLPPVASFALPRVVRLGGPVPIDPSASFDEDGTVAHFAWSLGDRTDPPQSAASGGPLQHAYARVGTYDVSLTVTDDEGCSTAATATCNGSSLAAQTRSVKVVYPRVRVRCPGSAGPKGCRLGLQGFTHKRHGVAETAPAKARVKAGKVGLVPLHPLPRYLGKLGVAKVVLVKQVLEARGARRTTFRRLIIR
jgi:YVTN family beta-propeller protein